MTAAVRAPRTGRATAVWEPDPLLADAARAGSVRLLDLGHAEQCWLVAHLTAAGYTAEETAARCGCGLRKIRYLRADPLTIMISRWLVADANARALAERADTLDRWCQSAIAQCEQNAGRARAQLDAAVDQIRILRARCDEERRRAALYRKYLGAPRSRRARPAPADQLALF